MSPGAGLAAEGSAQPVPAVPGRALVLSRLEAERRQAEGCFEHERAAELGAQIRRLSIGTAADPSRETTGRPAARKSRTA